MPDINHKVKYKITAKDLSKSVFKSLGNALPSIRTATIAAGAALTGLGIASVKATQHFAEFETEVINLGKVTSLPLDELKNRILDLSPELGSSTELVKGLYQTISAGVTEPNKAFELLTAAAKTSKAAHIDLDTTIKGITKLMAGFAGEIENAADASDLLFAIERSGQTAVADLAPVIGKLASLSKTLEINTTELGGAFSTLTLTAGDTAEAATQYSSIMSAMIKPTADMQALIKDLGFEEASDAIGELGFTGFLKKMQEATDGSSEALGKLFGNKRALIGVTQLLSNNMESLQKNISAVSDRSGLASKAFDDWKESLNALWDTFKNTVGKIVIQIVEKVAPDIAAGMSTINEVLLESSEEIVKFAEEFIKRIRSVAEESGLTKDDLKNIFIGLTESVLKFASDSIVAFDAFNKGFSGIISESESTANAVGFILDDMAKNTGDFFLALFGETEAIKKKAADSTAGVIGNIIRIIAESTNIIGPLIDIGNKFADVLESVIVFLTEFGLKVNEVFLGIPATTNQVDAEMSNFLDGIVSKFTSGGPKIQKASQEMFSGMKDTTEVALGPLTKIDTVINGINKNLAEDKEFKILTENGLLKITNVHEHLDPAAGLIPWVDDLNKEMTIDNATALDNIKGVEDNLRGIPDTILKELLIDTEQPETDISKVIQGLETTTIESERQRSVIIDFQQPIAAIDELIARFEALNKAVGISKTNLPDVSLNQAAGTNLSIQGAGGAGSTQNNNNQNVIINSNVNVSGAEDPQRIANQLDKALANNIRQGRSEISNALNQTRGQ